MAKYLYIRIVLVRVIALWLPTNSQSSMQMVMLWRYCRAASACIHGTANWDLGAITGAFISCHISDWQWVRQLLHGRRLPG